MEGSNQLPAAINIVFIGDQATGKSSLIIRSIKGVFTDDYSVISFFNSLGHYWS